MKSGQQKKSLDRFIYESMGEKQYLISCLDDDLFKKSAQRIPKRMVGNRFKNKRIPNVPRSASSFGIIH